MTIGTDSCVFAVRLDDEDGAAEVEARARALEAFYRFFAWHVAWRWLEGGRVLVGRLAPDAELALPLVWGAPLPPGIDGDDLLHGPAGALRVLDGVVAAVAADETEACVVTGAGGITAAYESTGPGVQAWATQAVAAAWLASGQASIEPDALPEQLACEFVGDERTLIAGARAVPPGTRIRVRPDVIAHEAFWPLAERWATVPEQDAYPLASTALLDALQRHLDGRGHTALGLTAGLDSRVLAVAVDELGLEVASFTWGEEGWEDVVEARRVAGNLGIGHARQPAEWLEQGAAHIHIDAAVRWTEAAIPIAPVRPTWPGGMDAWLYGAGGETGRAYYYAPKAGRYRTPSLSILARTWSPDARLVGARPEASAAVRRRVRGWLEGARALGLRGWRCLDQVYGEQRVRRWGRGMIPRHDATPVPGFTSPDTARALLSLPDADRVTDGFHRRFVAERRPDLALATVRPFDPAGHGASLARRVLAPAARAAGFGRVAPAPPARAFTAAHWEREPGLRAWLDEDVLGSPLLLETLGRPWVATVRAGFAADEAGATETALRAAAPIALAHALHELRAERSA